MLILFSQLVFVGLKGLIGLKGVMGLNGVMGVKFLEVEPVETGQLV